MPGYSDILIGYAERDPRREHLLTKYAGDCVSCGVRVYVVPSAFEILRRDDCDASLVCFQCDEKYPEDRQRIMT